MQQLLKKKVKNNSSKLVIYTTLEPCLMCFGAIIHCRISKLVYGCPDPFGGAAYLNPKQLKAWHQRRWPKIQGGLFMKESYDLMVKFMKGKKDWKKVLAEFEKIPLKTAKKQEHL